MDRPWVKYLRVFPMSRSQWWVRWTGADFMYRWLHPVTMVWVDEPGQKAIPNFPTEQAAWDAANQSPEPPTWPEFVKTLESAV